MGPPQGPRRVEVSVIVPVRDDPGIDDLLVSLAAQKEAPPFEVLVALDGAARQPVLPPGLAVRLVNLPARGPYAARNAAIQLAQGDLLLLTDSDCVCPPDWIATSFLLFADQSLTALQGASRALEDSRLSRLIQLEYDRRVDNFTEAFRRRYCDTRNFGIRAALARQVPLPDAFARGGDAVYGRLLEKKGIEIRYEPSWWIAHRHRSSRFKEGRRAFEMGRDGARWKRALGIDLFASANGSPPHGPGAWLASQAHRVPALRRAVSLALLPVAGAFSALSAVLPDALDVHAFNLFRRAAYLAGRMSGEAEKLGRTP